MKTENKNKPAFPSEFTHGAKGEFDEPVITHRISYGLTKREYFAGLAMQGLLVNYQTNQQYGNHPDYPMVEAIAVRCADQLLKELEK